MPSALVPLCTYFTTLKGEPTGLEFVDSTSLKVCHNIRIPRHKTFDGIARRGKSTMGWFFGFKLHLIVNHLGEIVAAKLTAANVHDIQPVPELAEGLPDKLYGDKGYVSKALEGTLFEKRDKTGHQCPQQYETSVSLRLGQSNAVQEIYYRNN
jgi:hypothetical protein